MGPEAVASFASWEIRHWPYVRANERLLTIADLQLTKTNVLGTDLSTYIPIYNTQLNSTCINLGMSVYRLGTCPVSLM